MTLLDVVLCVMCEQCWKYGHLISVVMHMPLSLRWCMSLDFRATKPVKQ